MTPSQSKRSHHPLRPARMAATQSGFCRFMSLRQSSCASWSRAVFSRHCGWSFQNFSLTCGKLDPCVNQNAVAMAGLDQRLQIFVALRIGIVEVPGCGVHRADTGVAPAFGQIIGIGAGAVGVIEERPEPWSAKGWRETEIGKRLHQIRKAFIAVRPGLTATQRTAPCPMRYRRSAARLSSVLWRRRARRRVIHSAGDRSPCSRSPEAHALCISTMWIAGDGIRGSDEAKAGGERR